MDLEPSDDQLALVDELRRLLAARVPTPALASEEVWGELEAMGVLTLPVAHADGGVGLGWAEAALAFQELGRSGVAGPFVATAAARAVGLGEGVTGLAAEGVGLVAGTRGRMAEESELPGRAAGPAPGGPEVASAGPADRVAGVGAGGPDGRAVVEHLDRLDALLVLGPDGVRQVPLPLTGARTVERPLDPLTPVHVVDSLPPGEAVGDAAVARRLGRHAALLAAAQQVGLGYAAVDAATAYAQEREQFGRPIGSFQAVKHLLADAVVGLEVARAAVDAAAVTTDEAEGPDDPGVTQAVASARVVASQAAAEATRASIQVHGGMGYTWELPAHLYLKRVLVLDQTPMTPETALDLLVPASA